MKIMQNDIFGQLHDTKPEKEKKPSMAVSKIVLRVLNNELSIKSGQLEPSTATRDSLIAFFVMPRCISK